MSRRCLTVAETIETLTRETGAPDSFVDRIRALFETRGIPLASSAGPYVPALEDAFRRNAALRKSVAKAHEDLGELQARLEIVGNAFSERVARLQAIRRNLERSGAMVPASRPDGSDAALLGVTCLVPGDFDRTIVPGPVFPC